MSDLKSIIKGFSGFKISGSHFRIGSKIHISDFYYAKRFFQNGFFSSRIAFLLARDIIATVEKEKKIDDIRNNGLTVVGYEMYSELLISLIDKFLRKKWQLSERKINHNLYEDVDNLRLCKKNNLLGNVVIVVPIASTFSTAIKIENQIILDQRRENNSLPNIIPPHLNVLYVSDGIPTNSLTEIEEIFSWKKKNIESKTITVDAIYSHSAEISRLQKYYLTLPTTWHNVESCELCGLTEKEKLDNELPLFETDRTAVTPAIVFDLPKGRLIRDADLDRKTILDTQTITYGHHTRNNTHFLYSINTELFLERNHTQIEKWLLEVKRSSEFATFYKETDRVIIVSSCHFSNVAFITLVNDLLFSSSANIIHYDPSNDYAQNFKIVYGQEINDADSIFFVDDSLKSGTSFDKIYQFIQSSLEQNDDKIKKGITGCFFLINKSQPYTFEIVKRKVLNPGSLHAFANLHLYTSLKPYETSPLEMEEDRYRELVYNSFLDSLKVHFLRQADKLALKSSFRDNPVSLVKSSRHLKMLIATHRIYQYFTIVSHPILNSFDAFFRDLFQQTKSPIDPSTVSFEDTKMLGEEAKAYLKVLTQSPFTQYKPLKDNVFKWTIELLTLHIKEVELSITKGSFSYDSFDTLKFLIRRAGLLNSNILISKTFLQFISKLYGSKGIPKLISDITTKTDESGPIFSKRKSELDEALAKLKDFHVFYAAQVKELLLRNESRCLWVEKMLRHIDSDSNLYVRQIARILREENSLIIQVFYEHIYRQEEWKKIYSQSDNGNNQAIDYTTNKLINFLSLGSISQHHKFKTLDNFFSTVNQPSILKNDSFLNYLWLQYFLSTDKNKTISLNYKTEFILKKLMQMFNCTGISKVGAFFITNDSQKKSFIAFNRNQNGICEIDDDILTSDSNAYLSKFFKGDPNSFKKEQQYKHSKTVIELKRMESGEWIDLFATSDSQVVDELSKDLIPIDYNRLVLVRLDKILKVQEKTQGLIGFYYNSVSESIVNINILRYLLLLRRPLSIFIERHHENDEFRDWQIAEIKQKTSLLTGHGREMLINIALNRGERYKDIVYTLLTIQRLLIDKKEANSLDTRSSRVKKIFEGFYQKTDSSVDPAFFNELSKMASDVFKFDEIENQEDLEVPILKVDSNLNFRFDKSLLYMICFELFVNAKKNRWLFLDKTLTTEDGDVYKMNRIWIEVEKTSTALILKISNTGPELSTESLSKMNRKRSIKKYDNSSGIELIDTILTEFELGSLRFSQERIKDRLSRITAILSLKQNSNE